MADLTVSVEHRFLKDNATNRGGPTSKSLTLAEAEFAKRTGTVGTTDATVDKGSIATLGICVVQNIDKSIADGGTGGDLLVGVDGTNYSIILKVGDPPAVFRANGADLHVKGSVANTKYQADLYPA